MSGGDQSPPKSHSPSLFSLSLFTVKTLSSNRSYLKQPAACKMNPYRAFVDLVGVILTFAAPECLKGNKVRQYGDFYFYIFTQFAALQFLYVLFLNVKEKKKTTTTALYDFRCQLYCFCLLVHSLQRPNNLGMHRNTCNYLTINCYLATGSLSRDGEG